MKSLKSLWALFAVSLFAFSHHAFAETQQKTQKTPKLTQAEKRQQAADAKALKEFNNSIGITYTGRSLLVDPNGQKTAVMRYTLENKSKKAIKSVYWVAVYALDKEAIHVKDVVLPFGQPYLASKSKVQIEVHLPFSEIAPAAHDIFGKPEPQIKAYAVARNITFSDNKRIDVKN